MLRMLSLLALCCVTLAQAPTSTNKPCSSEAFHQFDFWLGDWEVQDPKGQVVGHNIVASAQGGCLLTENWVAARGNNTGTSVNFYDARDQKWHQLYFDNTGDRSNWPELVGEFKEGRMVLLTPPSPSGILRWTWYVLSPDHVRQWAESSTDGGKTWKTIWDSVYVKTKPQA